MDRPNDHHFEICQRLFRNWQGNIQALITAELPRQHRQLSATGKSPIRHDSLSSPPLSATCYLTTTNRANSGYAQAQAVVSQTRGAVRRQRLDRCHYSDRGHAALPRNAGSACLFERLRSCPTSTHGEFRQGPIRQPIAASFASSFPFKSRHQERHHCLSRRRMTLLTAFDVLSVPETPRPAARIIETRTARTKSDLPACFRSVAPSREAGMCAFNEHRRPRQWDLKRLLKGAANPTAWHDCATHH